MTVGERGPTGDHGQDGQAGDTGQTGPVGETGQAGHAGRSGLPGMDGRTGERGAAGTDAAVFDRLPVAIMLIAMLLAFGLLLIRDHDNGSEIARTNQRVLQMQDQINDLNTRINQMSRP